MTRILVIGALALCSFFAAVSCRPTDPPVDQKDAAVDLAPFSACSANSDCIVYAQGCCCDVAAVNVAKRTEFQAQFDCSKVEQCDCQPRPPECPVCKQGQCEIVPAPDGGC